jgi:hypothetical protein
VGDRPSGTGDESSGIYEPGYSRIKNNVPNKQNGSKNDLDALYAKVFPKNKDIKQSSMFLFNKR